MFVLKNDNTGEFVGLTMDTRYVDVWHKAMIYLGEDVAARNKKHNETIVPLKEVVRDSHNKGERPW